MTTPLVALIVACTEEPDEAQLKRVKELLVKIFVSGSPAPYIAPDGASSASPDAEPPAKKSGVHVMLPTDGPLPPSYIVTWAAEGEPALLVQLKEEENRAKIPHAYFVIYVNDAPCVRRIPNNSVYFANRVQNGEVSYPTIVIEGVLTRQSILATDTVNEFDPRYEAVRTLTLAGKTGNIPPEESKLAFLGSCCLWVRVYYGRNRAGQRVHMVHSLMHGNSLDWAPLHNSSAQLSVSYMPMLQQGHAYRALSDIPRQFLGTPLTGLRVYDTEGQHEPGPSRKLRHLTMPDAYYCLPRPVESDDSE